MITQERRREISRISARKRRKTEKYKNWARAWAKKYKYYLTDHYKKYQSEYRKKKRREKLEIRLSTNIGCAMSVTMRGIARPHWENIVGYTVQELKEHLESQFKDGMSWENYGKYGWHIDHIIPISLWKYNSYGDREFKQCWALANLQPLWAKENKSKGNKCYTGDV